jgi:nicotinate-nucleotide--dimethylbenzimidazole phosphoribosyltransferase
VTRGERLEATVAAIAPFDHIAAADAAALFEAKTKPPGSLGRLEDLGCRIAGALGSLPPPRISKAIVVAAADHGVTAQDVSAYPSEVTRQMLWNFADGGAAVCVLGAGARLIVVDCGVAPGPTPPGVRVEVVGNLRGTNDFTSGPAMDRGAAVGLIERGIAVASELADDGVGVIALGEMGIGNTTAASAIVAALTGTDAASVCGPGTGLDPDGVRRKVQAIRRGLAANGLPRRDADPIEVQAAVGGLEIAFLVGVLLGAASRRRAVVLDGFITGAAALVAARIAPASVGSMIAATRSPEPGHMVVLAELGLEPLLDLSLRLGEGSGAALALPLLDAAVAILHEMATFDSSGVSGPAGTADAPRAGVRTDA